MPRKKSTEIGKHEYLTALSPCAEIMKRPSLAPGRDITYEEWCKLEVERRKKHGEDCRVIYRERRCKDGVACAVVKDRRGTETV